MKENENMTEEELLNAAETAYNEAVGKGEVNMFSDEDIEELHNSYEVDDNSDEESENDEEINKNIQEEKTDGNEEFVSVSTDKTVIFCVIGFLIGIILGLITSNTAVFIVCGLLIGLLVGLLLDYKKDKKSFKEAKEKE